MMSVILTSDDGPRVIFGGRVTIPGVLGVFFNSVRIGDGIVLEYCWVEMYGSCAGQLFGTDILSVIVSMAHHTARDGKQHVREGSNNGGRRTLRNVKASSPVRKCGALHR